MNHVTLSFYVLAILHLQLWPLPQMQEAVRQQGFVVGWHHHREM